MESIRFKVEGMSCASCASGIEKLSSKVDGIKACEVNYAMETAYLEVDSSESIASFKSLLKDNGYGLLEDDSSLEKQSESKDIAFKFIVGFIFSILIFSLEMGPLKNTFDRNTNWLLQFFLASPIWIWIGASFQSSVLSFIRTGHSNMNTLIGIGTSAAYLYSSFLILFPELSLRVGLSQKVYFEAVGFIISFVYLGKFFEEKAKRKTKEALNALFSLSAKHALKVEDGEVVTISQSDVAIGDVLRVLPGAVIPVDGKLTKGSSYVDESMISGEPIPVFKNAGDEVFAGTINSDGSFDYRATKVGKDTFLAKIIEFVESAQSSKPKIQRYADKIGGIFTPVVIIIAVLTFALWMIFGAEPLWGNSVSNFIAVLVIACPCALGLATPTAVVVATGRASLKGLLIGGGEVLEKAVGVNAVVFDKTGTLTKGKPEVLEYVESESGLLRAASSIEQFSEHPLSKAIINFSSSKKLSLGEPDSFEVVKGKGIESHFEGDDYLLGSEALLVDKDIELNPNLKIGAVGSYVHVAKNLKHVASFLIGDQIKDQVAEAISNLKASGIKTIMLTGDNEVVAKAVSNTVGIDEYHANVLPIDKSSYLDKLKSEGYQVAMIGDGVNDAPALAKADLSFAMGTGTEVAINASDVTIVGGDINKVLDFLNLSKGTMKVIKQNLFLSLIYNLSLIPVAAGALVVFGGPMMPPVLASVAMALSSISVVTNSLRIRSFI